MLTTLAVDYLCDSAKSVGARVWATYGWHPDPSSAGSDAAHFERLGEEDDG
jgi:hypothetical protein